MCMHAKNFTLLILVSTNISCMGLNIYLGNEIVHLNVLSWYFKPNHRFTYLCLDTVKMYKCANLITKYHAIQVL